MGHDLSREKEGGWGKDERANGRPCFEMSRGGGRSAVEGEIGVIVGL